MLFFSELHEVSVLLELLSSQIGPLVDTHLPSVASTIVSSDIVHVVLEDWESVGDQGRIVVIVKLVVLNKEVHVHVKQLVISRLSASHSREC